MSCAAKETAMNDPYNEPEIKITFYIFLAVAVCTWITSLMYWAGVI